jgi:DNA-binding GntR family transcriptional regulator
MTDAEATRLSSLAQTSSDVLAANREIHLAIVRAAGNQRAASVVERLLDDSERARIIAVRAGAAEGGERARTELQAVLAAIGDGDGPHARALMAQAISVFRDELVERLQQAALDRPL